jgi:hypothetical protein
VWLKQSKTPALQSRNPEFKLQSHQKNQQLKTSSKIILDKTYLALDTEVTFLGRAPTT